MKKVLYTVALTAALSLNLTACQQGYTKEQVDELTALSERSKETAMELELYLISSASIYARNQIHGENIPEVFKAMSLEKTDDYALHFTSDKQDDLHYVNFVRDLKINCDGSISYTSSLNVEAKLTWEEFIFSARWRAENLSICGKLEVPEWKKLIILATKSTHLQDIQFSTQKNSLLALILKNTQYEGAAPILNVSPKSIISFEFE